MSSKWHVNILVPAREAATAHLPASVPAETGWIPAGSLRQADRTAKRVGHAMAQLCGGGIPEAEVYQVNKDRREVTFKAPRGDVIAIIARSGTEAGEDERTHNYRKGRTR